MKKYDYCHLTVSPLDKIFMTDVDARMKKLGQEGWQAYAVDPSGFTVSFFFISTTKFYKERVFWFKKEIEEKEEEKEKIKLPETLTTP